LAQALSRRFRADAGEDARGPGDAFYRMPAPMISCSNPSLSFSSARMSARISSSVRSGCGL
jgi:hypothetical protein